MKQKKLLVVVIGNGEIDKTYRDVSVSFLNLSNTYFMDIAQKIVDTVEEANNRLWNFDIQGVCEEILYLTYNKGQHYQLHSDVVWTILILISQIESVLLFYN